MSETNIQRSRLTLASDEQAEAHSNFDAVTQAIIDSHPPSSLAPPTSPDLPSLARLHQFKPLPLDPAQPREEEKELEKSEKAERAEKTDSPDHLRCRGHLRHPPLHRFRRLMRTG